MTATTSATDRAATSGPSPVEVALARLGRVARRVPIRMGRRTVLVLRGVAGSPDAFVDWYTQHELEATAKRLPDESKQKSDLLILATHRRDRNHQTVADAFKVMVALAGGGWWFASSVLLAVSGFALWHNTQTTDKDQGGKAVTRGLSGVRWSLISLAVSIGLEFADWHWLGSIEWAWSWQHAAVWSAGPVTLAFLVLLKWAWNGTIADDLEDASHTDGIDTDTRYNRIVLGFATKLNIKNAETKEPDPKKIKVIGPGLEPVDALWSKMRLQFPGTLTNDKIEDAAAGVASFMGISAERLDVVGAEDEHGREIQGVVDVWLASGDPWKNMPMWPALSADQVSVWEPVPFIVTDRGQPLLAALLFASWMLISKARHGKTFAQRLLAFAFALDPSADYAVFDFKPGGRDWFWSRKSAVACGFGNSSDTVRAFRDYLQSVLDSATDNGLAFQALPEELVPHGQLTKAACQRDKRLRPLGIFVDEVHHALMHPEYGKDIAKLMAKIIRELPFLAVQVFIASQKADVRTSIPSEVRNLIPNRVAGKLLTSRDSGDVLGDAANELGYNAKHLRAVQGLFIVHGADDTSSFDGYAKGRSYLVDNLQASQIGERAYALRKAAGVLPARVEGATEVAEELTQVIEMLRDAGVSSMRSEEVAGRMGTTPQRLIKRINVRSRIEPADNNCRHLYLIDLEACANGAQGLRVVS